MPENKDELVTVTVAKRRTIHHRLKKGDQLKVFRQGDTLEVPKWDVQRLIDQGFIVDPDERVLTAEEIAAAAGAEGYLPGRQGQVDIQEEAEQSVKPGKASGKRAA